MERGSGPAGRGEGIVIEAEVRLAMLKMLSALDAGAIALEVTADELAHAAEMMADDPAAEVLLGFSRRDRVKALEMRGQFAAMKKEYAARFHSD